MKKSNFFIFTLFFFTHCTVLAQWVKTSFPKNDFSHSITYGKGDTLFVYIDGIGNFFRSTDDGNSWQNIYKNIPKENILGAISYCENYLVANLYDPFNLDSTKAVYLSSDNGDHWQIASGNGASFESATLFIDFDNYLFAAYGTGGLARSDDCGNSWHGVSHGIQGAGILGMVKNSGYVYLLSYGEGVCRSPNNGDSSWVIPKKQPTTFPHSIAVIGHSIFTSDGFLYRSDDSAEHWKTVIYDTTITNLVVSNNRLIAYGRADHDMVLCSSDLGVSWKDLTNNLSGKGIFPFFANDTSLFAIVDGEIWRRSLSQKNEITIGNTKTCLHLSLSPNPATTSSHITYSIPKRSDVLLEAFDVMGRKVSSIAHTTQDAGSNEVVWDTKQIPSGSYIIRLSACGESVSKIIEIVK